MSPLIPWACLVQPIFIASVQADSLDDFTNNLFTDLGPILALFGERVTMQFLGQALGWADCLALAMAPLGIITILVSAIRVGGPKWLQAVIGRAKENTAAAEMELMSSTSTEVCELFNGDSIVRCQGTSPVWEFICIFPDQKRHGKSRASLPLRYMTLEMAIEQKLLSVDSQSSPSIPQIIRKPFQHKDHPSGSKTRETSQGPPRESLSVASPYAGFLDWIHKFFLNNRFLSTRADPELGPDRPPQASNSIPETQPSPDTRSEPFIAIIRDTSPRSPNISLNLQNSHRRTGIRFVAVLGILLQSGVLVFFGVMSYYPKVQPSFSKEDQTPASYASPLAITGTLLLVLGMFVCSLVVDSSTEETRYRTTAGSKFVMCWVQQGQTVSDQVFESYAMSQSMPCSVITKSARGNTREGKNRTLEAATVSGVIIGLVGFIIQFVGLRAMNSAASLAQLAAIGIMTLFRALVRPGFASSFGKAKLLPGFELNWLAWELVTTRSVLEAHQAEAEQGTSNELARTDKKDGNEANVSPDQSWVPEDSATLKGTCGSWTVATGERIEYRQLCARVECDNAAQELLSARREICKMAAFQGKATEIAVNLALSMEDALNLLLPYGIGKPWLGPTEISWLIGINSNLSPWAETTRKDISIDLSCTSGFWHVPADSLDAIISLWTQTIQERAKRQQELGTGASPPSGYSGDGWLRRRAPKPSLRLLGPVPQLCEDFEFWAPKNYGDLTMFKEFQTFEELERYDGISHKGFDSSRVVGCTAVAGRNKNGMRHFARLGITNVDEGDLALEIATHDSIELLLAKDLFFSLICSAARTPGARLQGEPELRQISNGDKPYLQNLWNKGISDLAESCHQRGLGTYEEVSLSIISPLSMAKLLPFPHSWFEAVCAEIAEDGRNKGEDAATTAYHMIWSRTQNTLPKHSSVRKCAQALLLEALHDVEKRPSPLENWQRFSSMIPLMCGSLKMESQFLENLKRLSKWSHRPLNFDPVHVTDAECAHDEGPDDEVVNEASHEKNQSLLKGFPAYFMLTQSHVNTTGYGQDLSHNLQVVLEDDKGERDICGRVPLHYLAGTDAEKDVVSVFLRFGSDFVNTCDYHGYTPLHYACGFGSGQTVRLLLERRAKLDTQGLDGLFPMHLAAYEGNEAAINAITNWTSLPGKPSLTSICRLRDYSNNLPIHWAVTNGHEKVMELLKADINMEGLFGRTPLFFAVQHGGRDLLQRVVELSEDLNKKDQDDITALNYACSLGHWEDARILLEAGADPDICDRWGRNAVDTAVEKEASPDLIRVMRKEMS